MEGRPLTTRGRWLNWIVFPLFHLTRFFSDTKGSHRPIYIIGTGRSGTTLLGQILGIHKELIFLNEPKALWHYAIRGEDIIGSYDDEPGRIRLDFSENMNETRSRIARTYTFAARIGRASRVADKYPELLFRIPYVLNLFPRARFLAIVRDGVDTCISVASWSLKNQRQSGNELHDWWGKNDRKWQCIVNELVPEYADLSELRPLLTESINHFDRAAVEWILSMREVRSATALHAEVLVVRYESLLLNPKSTMLEVFQHCELEHDPVVHDYANSIMKPSSRHGVIHLMPDLVPIMIGELNEMGYLNSAYRVKARQ